MTKRKRSQVQQALLIKKTLGLKSAAGYLRDRGWTVTGAVWLLVQYEPMQRNLNL